MGAMPTNRLAFGILPWYSLIMVCAISLAVFLCAREEKRLKLPKDTAVDVALMAIPLGIIGARLYYVAFSWDQFAYNPIRILYVWEGGIAIYGAIIGGFAGMAIIAKRRKFLLRTLLDMAAPGLIIAQALGRWGNYFNMEAYGVAVTNPQWQFFPFAVLIQENGQPVWHLATFFYESCWNVITFLLLMSFRSKMSHKGDVFLWYVLLYGAGRAVIEGLRTDSLMWGGSAVRISQWLSLVACGIALMVLLLRNLHSIKKVTDESPKKANLFPFAPGVACILLWAYFLLAGAYLNRAFPIPVFLAVLLLTCVTGICVPVVRSKWGFVPCVPLILIGIGQVVFLFYYKGAQSPLLLQTWFITFLALGFPAMALAVYPLTGETDD